MVTIFEVYLKLLRYDIYKAAREVVHIQLLSPKAFHRWQHEQKWRIARYHYENNLFYRRKVGDTFPDKWEDLPLMQKSDYQDDLSNLLSKGYSTKNTYISSTSGSSGHPFFFAKNKEAHAMDWALIKNRYSWHGLKLNPRQARFYGIPLEKISYLKEIIKDKMMNRVRFPVFDLSNHKLKKYLACFKKNKFVIVYGYTNSIVIFARYLLNLKIKLKDVCPSLQYCITTSEVLTVEDRQILEDAFGVKVINEYGASETGIIAFEDSEGDWKISEEILDYEIIDDENKPIPNGQEGNIVITDLDNKAMPFIRYKIGDIGIISTKSSSDGKSRVLEKLLGRENDTIILPSGKRSPGLTFYYISRSILESSGVLKEFIIRQTSVDKFEYDVVSDRDLNLQEIKEIRGQMHKYLEPGLKLTINRVKTIKRPRSGKIKHFYSEIP